MNHPHRLPIPLRLAIVVAGMSAALALAPAVLAQSSSLGGQAFSTTAPDIWEQTESDINCSWNDGRVTFEVRGTATGPYTGIFYEQGEATFDRFGGTEETDWAMPLTGFHSTFQIEDGGTVLVSGEKYFADGSEGLVGCPGRWFEDFESKGAITGLGYTATLPDGSPDQGTSVLEWDWSFTARLVGSFTETFSSGEAPPPPPPPSQPTSNADCKNGGYAQYGYPNQGQCVRYVVTPPFVAAPGKEPK